MLAYEGTACLIVLVVVLPSLLCYHLQAVSP